MDRNLDGARGRLIIDPIEKKDFPIAIEAGAHRPVIYFRLRSTVQLLVGTEVPPIGRHCIPMIEADSEKFGWV